MLGLFHLSAACWLLFSAVLPVYGAINFKYLLEEMKLLEAPREGATQGHSAAHPLLPSYDNLMTMTL